MPSDASEADFLARLGRVEALVELLERHPDAAVRDAARELVGTVLTLHARGLRRLLELSGGAADLSRAALEPTLGGLLALHGLHPTPIAERVRRALADLEPKLTRSGARTELLSTEGDVVRVRLHGPVSMTSVVREALAGAVPDAAEIVVEDAPVLVPLRLRREAAVEVGAKR
jgi:hypothetical protein